MKTENTIAQIASILDVNFRERVASVLNQEGIACSALDLRVKVKLLGLQETAQEYCKRLDACDWESLKQMPWAEGEQILLKALEEDEGRTTFAAIKAKNPEWQMPAPGSTWKKPFATAFKAMKLPFFLHFTHPHNNDGPRTRDLKEYVLALRKK